MSMTDPIADMLAAIKNGQMANKPSIIIPASKVKKSILEVLKNEGYINGYSDAEVVKKKISAKPGIKIDLRYFEGQPVIKNIKRMSTPGRRVYASVKDMPKIYNGLGVIVVSTSKGMMSDFDARQQKIGGELVCSIF